MGRHTIMTPETLKKLDDAFIMGCPDLEACLLAGIGKTTLYDYQKENPEFVERKEALKNSTTLQARRNLAASIASGDLMDSKWYLERKAKNEFSTKTETEMNVKLDNEWLKKVKEPLNG